MVGEIGYRTDATPAVNSTARVNDPNQLNTSGYYSESFDSLSIQDVGSDSQSGTVGAVSNSYSIGDSYESIWGEDSSIADAALDETGTLSDGSTITTSLAAVETGTLASDFSTGSTLSYDYQLSETGGWFQDGAVEGYQYSEGGDSFTIESSVGTSTLNGASLSLLATMTYDPSAASTDSYAHGDTTCEAYGGFDYSPSPATVTLHEDDSENTSITTGGVCTTFGSVSATPSDAPPFYPPDPWDGYVGIIAPPTDSLLGYVERHMQPPGEGYIWPEVFFLEDGDESSSFIPPAAVIYRGGLDLLIYDDVTTGNDYFAEGNLDSGFGAVTDAPPSTASRGRNSGNTRTSSTMVRRTAWLTAHRPTRV